MAMILDVANLQLPGGTDKFGHALIALKDALVARGWTVEGSSDGFSTFERKGQTAGPYDVFTAAQPWAISGSTWNSGVANSISNRYAWMILREPSPSVREFAFQRSNGNTTSHMNYLYNLKFSTIAFPQSGCSTTTMNTPLNAAMIAVRHNAGGTAFGSGAVQITDTANHYLNIMVSDSAEADGVWPFYCVGWNSATQARAGELFYMALEDTVPGDPEPWAFGSGYLNSTTSLFGLATTSFNSTQEWWVMDQAEAGGKREAVGTTYDMVGSPTPGAGVNNVLANIDGKVRAQPYRLYTESFRWKGRMKYVWVNPLPREYPATVDLATASPYVCIGQALLPWKTNVVPLF